MEKVGVYFGIILLFCVGLMRSQGPRVSVGDDRMVKPGKEMEVLNCIGSEGDIAYYIRNRVAWNFTDKDGMTHRLSYGFYDDSSDPYTANLKVEKRLHYNYTEVPENKDYSFAIYLSDIQFSDDGTYTCTLYDEGNNIIDSKSMKLTVVAPVRKLRLELHDSYGVLASRESFTENDLPVNLAPGMYKVFCQAEGSNPEPMMSLYYNQDKLTGKQMNERVTSGEGPTYTSRVNIEELNLMSKSTEQLIMCEANIDGDYYQQKRAGIKLSVTIDKPDFICANLTTKPGDKYRKIDCQLLTIPGKQAPVCDKAFWKFGDSGRMIEIQSEEKYTDPEKQYHIMESACMTVVNGLEVNLTFYMVQPIHMKTTFYIVYGVGSDAEEYPVQIYLKETSGASVITPVTLLVSLMVAIFGRHIAKNL